MELDADKHLPFSNLQSFHAEHGHLLPILETFYNSIERGSYHPVKFRFLYFKYRNRE